MTENHTPQKSQTRYLTKGEVASKYGFGVRTIDRWMSRGWLKFVKLPNGQVRFRENDVLQAMDREWNSKRGAGVSDPSMG